MDESDFKGSPFFRIMRFDEDSASVVSEILSPQDDSR